MGEIERIATDLVAQYVEQMRPFTDRIAQLESLLKQSDILVRKFENKAFELKASNKKLREAIDAIYDPNCDCYLCVTFREALEE